MSKTSLTSNLSKCSIILYFHPCNYEVAKNIFRIFFFCLSIGCTAYEKLLKQTYSFGISRPRSNVLASRSKVRAFKPGWDRWIFSGRKNPEHKSSRRDFKLGPETEISGSLKNLKPEKIGLWAKFNRHIHVLVIPKFGGAQ